NNPGSGYVDNTFAVTAATSGVETGSNIGAGTFTTSTANQFTVSIDGGTAQTLSSIQTQISNQLGSGATVAIAGTGATTHLTITSNSTGTNSSIQIGAGGSTGLGTGDA